MHQDNNADNDSNAPDEPAPAAEKPAPAEEKLEHDPEDRFVPTPVEPPPVDDEPPPVETYTQEERIIMLQRANNAVQKAQKKAGTDEERIRNTMSDWGQMLGE